MELGLQLGIAAQALRVAHAAIEQIGDAQSGRRPGGGIVALEQAEHQPVDPPQARFRRQRVVARGDEADVEEDDERADGQRHGRRRRGRAAMPPEKLARAVVVTAILGRCQRLVGQEPIDVGRQLGDGLIPKRLVAIERLRAEGVEILPLRP
ncbi:hypothetical protein D3C83_07610 [compost metagenome]